MALSRQEATRKTGSGRVNQKTRTRQAILNAAIELARQGRPPSIPEAAERALVSAATAYRYFPSAQALWDEASFEMTVPWDNFRQIVEAAGDDPAARLDAVIRSIGWSMLDEELPYRNLARSSLERWFEQIGLPDGARVPVREGRRLRWNATVLEPLHDELPESVIQQLTNALGLVWGTEAVLVLRDVCRLDVDESKQVMRDAARWMLQGALAEARDTSGTRQEPRTRTRTRRGSRSEGERPRKRSSNRTSGVPSGHELP